MVVLLLDPFVPTWSINSHVGHYVDEDVPLATKKGRFAPTMESSAHRLVSLRIILAHRLFVVIQVVHIRHFIQILETSVICIFFYICNGYVFGFSKRRKECYKKSILFVRIRLKARTIEYFYSRINYI